MSLVCAFIEMEKSQKQWEYIECTQTRDKGILKV